MPSKILHHLFCNCIDQDPSFLKRVILYQDLRLTISLPFENLDAVPVSLVPICDGLMVFYAIWVATGVLESEFNVDSKFLSHSGTFSPRWFWFCFAVVLSNAGLNYLGNQIWKGFQTWSCWAICVALFLWNSRKISVVALGLHFLVRIFAFASLNFPFRSLSIVFDVDREMEILLQREFSSFLTPDFRTVDVAASSFRERPRLRDFVPETSAKEIRTLCRAAMHTLPPPILKIIEDFGLACILPKTLDRTVWDERWALISFESTTSQGREKIKTVEEIEFSTHFWAQNPTLIRKS